jgi:uncharacterized cofD-like protein
MMNNFHLKDKLRFFVLRVRSALRWLYPGIGVKRWLLVVLLGTTLLGVGLAVLVLDVYRNAPDTWWLPILSYASLRFIARPIRALIFGGLGVGLILLGIWGINRSLLAPYTRPGKGVYDTVSLHRKKERGPQIVAIGGGHGLSILLRGLKEYSYNITAVVTVADDGGSSGRIRQALGILPPGDIRNCLAALSGDEALLSQLFQYRFEESEDGLGGHSFGNLFISALVGITGSFEEAVSESGRVLSIHGRVLPATLRDVRLIADVSLPHLSNPLRVEGESNIPQTSGHVRRVWLEPSEPLAYPVAIRAILAADIIVVGPGSLYTSILPNLLVPEVTRAIEASRALKIYVCNVANQPGETDGYSCKQYLTAIEEHVGKDLFDIILCSHPPSGKKTQGIEWVIFDEQSVIQYQVHVANIVNDVDQHRHDSKKLARVIFDLWQERTGPLVE